METIGLELEDDLLFAELNREISLLIMDDDEHLHNENSLDVHYPDPSISLYQVNSYFQQVMVHDHHIFPQTLLYGHHHQNVPLLRDQIRGTGVFIPQLQQQRKNNNINKQHQQQQVASDTTVKTTSYTNQNHHRPASSRPLLYSPANSSINGIY